MIAGGLSRRCALRSAAGVGVGVGVFGLHSALYAAGPVTMPIGPMRLTRRLVRGLANGGAITVTRSWRVVFAAQSRGMAITGEQLDASVDAPPALAQLSKIEEERSTAGMFPILLSVEGIIMMTGEGTDTQSLAEAMDAARAIIAARRLPPEIKSQQRSILQQLETAGGTLLSTMPGDLFFPATQPRREREALILPDGAEGEFEINWEASTLPGTALLDRMQREVITRIGSSVRKSTETWTMAPL